MIELKDFISETLSQIISGVRDAQIKSRSVGGRIVPYTPIYEQTEKWDGQTGAPIQGVEFDVLVTTLEGTNTDGKAGVFVGVLSLGTSGASINQEPQSLASSSLSLFHYLAIQLLACSWGLTIHSSRCRFAARLNSGVRPRMKITDEQTSVEALEGFGTEATRLLCTGDFSALAERYNMRLPTTKIQHPQSGQTSRLVSRSWARLPWA